MGQDARVVGRPQGDDRSQAWTRGTAGRAHAVRGGYDRQPAEEMVVIDATRGHADAAGAGPNRDADTLVDDPHASRDKRA
jgi:hypothetical protein